MSLRMMMRASRPAPASVAIARLAVAFVAIAGPAGAQSLRLNPGAVVALDRVRQWYALRAPEDNPITPAQLEAAALRPASVARLRALFERAIARGVRIDGPWLTPEAGGEAVLNEELELLETPDTRWDLVAQLAARASDPAAMAAWVEARAAGIAAIDPHGLLKVAAARLRLGSRGASEELRRAALTVARNAATTYEHDPGAQLALITSRDWRGRYVGRWHLHPPHDAGTSWSGGAEPSYEDMQNAAADGQYLTLAFHPEGFDLYDASELGDLGRVDASALRVIRYRSPGWREHFAKLHARVKAGTKGLRDPS